MSWGGDLIPLLPSTLYHAPSPFKIISASIPSTQLGILKNMFSFFLTAHNKIYFKILV